MVDLTAQHALTALEHTYSKMREQKDASNAVSIELLRACYDASHRHRYDENGSTISAEIRRLVEGFVNETISEESTS